MELRMEAVRRAHAARSLTASLAPRRRPAGGDVSFLIRWLATWLAVAFLFLCGYLLTRGLAASFQLSSTGAAVSAVLFAILWSTVLRLLSIYAGSRRESWRSRMADGCLTVGLVFVGTWATAVSGSVATAILIWMMIAAAELAAALLKRRSSWMIATPAPTGGARRSQATVVDARVRGADVWQQQTRERPVDGGEWIHGTLRAAFAAGQRTGVEHLVFCPLLASVPQVTAAAVDELECTVRATHVYRYGARLEIRLREPCDELVEVLVRYEARV